MNSTPLLTTISGCSTTTQVELLGILSTTSERSLISSVAISGMSREKNVDGYLKDCMLVGAGECFGHVNIWKISEKFGKNGCELVATLPHGDDEVTSVCFGNRKVEMFCSASNSAIKLWNVMAYRNGLRDNEGWFIVLV